MKKFLLAALLVVALLLTLVACTEGDKEAATTAAEQATTVAEAATTVAEAKTTVAEVATTVAEATTAAEAATTVAEATTAAEVETTVAEEATTEEETTEEETTADPSAPILFFSPEDIQDAVDNGVHANNMATEYGYKSIKLTPYGDNVDPYFYLAQNVVAGKYAIIKYKSPVAADGEFFIGSTGNPHGGTDQVTISYENTNGDWGYALVYLMSNADYDGENAAYIRYDFYKEAGDTLEVAWIAFFDDVNYAMLYYYTNAFDDGVIAQDDADAQIQSTSFDTFYINGESLYPENEAVGTRLADEYGDTVTFKYGQAHDELIFRGWAYFEQAIDTFGYYTKGDYELAEGLTIPVCIFMPDETDLQERLDVKEVIGELAEGYRIDIDISTLGVGEWTIGIAARLEDGRIVSFYEVTVVIEDAEGLPAGSGMATDIYYEDDECKAYAGDCDIVAWLRDNRADGISGVETASFRGWCGLGDLVIDSFGYALGDSEPVFDAGWTVDKEENLPTASGQPNVERYYIFVPVSSLPVGEYDLKLLVKDTDGNIYQMTNWGDLKVVSYGERPSAEEYDETVTDLDLGIGDRNGTPVASGQTFGYKISFAEGVYLNTITVVQMATYTDPATSGTATLYYWDTDLATTRESTPIAVVDVINHSDCSDLVVDFSKYNVCHAGDYYVEFKCTEKTTGNWTPWGVDAGDAMYAVGYVGDTETPFCAKINVSTYEPKPEHEDPDVVDVSEVEAVVAHSFDSEGGRWLNNNEEHVGEEPEGGAKAWFTGWIGTTEAMDEYKIGLFVVGTDIQIENDFVGTEDGEVTVVAQGQGATYALRYTIEECFPMAELPEGTYTVIGYIKTADGTMFKIGEYELVKE